MPHGTREGLLKTFSPLLPADCSKVYVDIGLNIGDNLRVLYEPTAAASNRKLNRTFGSLFGSVTQRAGICTVGIEPNPVHSTRLAALQKLLTERGHRVQLFGVAISNMTGSTTFWTDTAPHNIARNGWGNSVLRWAANMDRSHAVQVPTLTLTSAIHSLFLRTGVGAQPKQVVGMKIDCEGCEYDAIPQAAVALCSAVDVMWLERHDRFFNRAWRGHQKGFESMGRLERLDAAVSEMRARHTGRDCRTDVRALSTSEHGRRA